MDKEIDSLVKMVDDYEICFHHLDDVTRYDQFHQANINCLSDLLIYTKPQTIIAAALESALEETIKRCIIKKDAYDKLAEKLKEKDVFLKEIASFEIDERNIPQKFCRVPKIIEDKFNELTADLGRTPCIEELKILTDSKIICRFEKKIRQYILEHQQGINYVEQFFEKNDLREVFVKRMEDSIPQNPLFLWGDILQEKDIFLVINRIHNFGGNGEESEKFAKGLIDRMGSTLTYHQQLAVEMWYFKGITEEEFLSKYVDGSNEILYWAFSYWYKRNRRYAILNLTWKLKEILGDRI